MQSLQAYDGESSSSSHSSLPPAASPTSLTVPSAAPVDEAPPSPPPPRALARASLLPKPAAPPRLPHGSAQSAAVDPAAFDRNLYAFGGRTQADPASGATLVPRPPKRPRTAAPPAVGARGVGAEAQKRAAVGSGGDVEKVTASGTSGGDAEIFVPSTELLLRGPRGKSGAWLRPPSGARTFEEMETYTPYIPRRAIQTFAEAHGGKGVGAVRFIPGTGHLLLSAGLDGSVKVWEMAEGRRGCVRKYAGHRAGVRDICWAQDGKSFLSASYDRSLLLWDAEYGKVKGRFTGNDAVPFCVKINPDQGRNTEFLVGCSDKKVIQMDMRDGNKIVQSYDQHMGAVNSLAFVDDNRRFVSSADDRVLRVWDYGIPVVIKYISDPTMHSMPVVALHPNGKWISCQGMDNNVSVLSVRDRFRLNPRKSFSGHLVAGYACGLAYSPDGRFLASGDSMGRAFFWDWKTARMFRALKAHKGVCIDLAWHPTESSRVVSCGWDGDIKVWD